jgi:protoheme IX farnesyltransferase
MINYYLITKPGIILGNLITLAAGFLLASKGQYFDISLFFATLLGLTFVMASACVFNNYIDRHLDKKMQRTKNRALVIGLISGPNAIVFGTILGIIGGLILYAFTNVLALLMAAIGFFVYVVLYSMWKSRTVYGTAIGSVAGAMPPVVGYCAVAGRLDLGAFILFFMLVLWQMPHFFSIAIYRLEDYTKAKIPVLPVIEGMLRTKIHMVIYILAFLVVASLLTFFGYTGQLFLIVTLTFGFAWFGLCILGFTTQNEMVWGRQMFRLSLLLITAICLVVPFESLLLSS